MLERSFNYVSFPEFAARFWRIQVEVEIEIERESERNGATIAPILCPEESYPLTEC